jgi:hypothetical protein
MSPNSKARPSTPAQAAKPPVSEAPPVEATPPPPSQEPQPIDHEAELAAGADAVAHIIEDDDTLNLPAASPESILRPRQRPRPKRELMFRTVHFKQTIIPIMLTLGVLLPALGGYCLWMGDESPLPEGKSVPVTIVGLGVVMLAFAVLTMLQVKHELGQRAQGQAAGVR